MATWDWIPIIGFRWLHVISACLLVGATFFLAFILPAGIRESDAAVGNTVYLRSRRIFKMTVHSCILFLLISGIYNAIGNWGAYKRGIPLTHGLFGPHVLLAGVVFAILLTVLAPREPRKTQWGWLRLTFGLLLVTVLCASALKYAREHPVRSTSADHLVGDRVGNQIGPNQVELAQAHLGRTQ